MNNECNATHTTAAGNTYRCNMHKGHEGDHKRMNVRCTYVLYSWPRTAVELHPSNFAHVVDEELAKVKADLKQGLTPVLFSTHELAELYVILSGNHDIPEVYLNKLGAALKKSL